MSGTDHARLEIVKVGGSLFELPDLQSRLKNFLSALSAARILLVPGGGSSADVIRRLDRIHALGEEAAHWLALRAASVNAYFLRALLPRAEVVAFPSEVPAAGIGILDAFTFGQRDEGQPGSLPSDWHTTTDAIAARAALVGGARRLHLLKSTDLGDAQTLRDAVAASLVDRVLPDVIEGSNLEVSWVNLRKWPKTPPRTVLSGNQQ
jgi:5-(aminomethyl)-3-furanmethanol phosphate kinase